MARMIRFNIESIVVSKIFGSIDTAHGDVSIADDGRYSAEINGDLYLFDGKCIWEYSAQNAQATKQCLKEDEEFENRLFFLKNLDHYYSTSSVSPDSIYKLIRAKEDDDALPDSLLVTLSESRLVKMEYYDLNNDLNVVSLKKESLSDSVENRVFSPAFPDSTEIIDLP